MPLKLPVLLVIFLHGFAIIASASGLDPIRDFCVADTASATNTLQCKNSSAAMVEDFVFSGIKFPGKFSEIGFSAKSVNVKVFPGLNTLCMSFVRADFYVGGVNVPHFHPRATEVAFVLEGRIYSGFVDTDNKIFAKVIGEGQNPGLQRIPNAVFGSGIKEELLHKAFGLSSTETAQLRRKLSPHELS
ncbi:hypothetical protein SLE2022_067580 [Rubroshorea leprosula]